MCNLYTIRLSREEVAALFRHRTLIDKNYRDVVNVYPNGEAPVCMLEPDGRIAIKEMRWGFPPPPTYGVKRPVTNVRNTSSSYWRPWLKATTVTVGTDVGGRCVVPVSKFAEPDKNTGMKVNGSPLLDRSFAPVGRPPEPR